MSALARRCSWAFSWFAAGLRPVGKPSVHTRKRAILFREPDGELLMLSETLLDVARGWPGATNVRACEVKIGRQTYEGFSYTTPENEQRFYLLGDRPPSSKRHVYRIDGDEGDWFLGAYGSPEGEHPLGAHFLLMRWPHEQYTTRIDAHEIGRHGRIHPYPRMRIEVTYASPEN